MKFAEIAYDISYRRCLLKAFSRERHSQSFVSFYLRYILAIADSGYVARACFGCPTFMFGTLVDLDFLAAIQCFVYEYSTKLY